MQQIPRNIELIRYKLFGEDLLLLDLVNAVAVDDATSVKEKHVDGNTHAKAKLVGKDKMAQEQLEQAHPEIRELYEAVSSQLLALGDDVLEKHLKRYVASRRLKNFTCVIPYKEKPMVMLKLNPIRSCWKQASAATCAISARGVQVILNCVRGTRATSSAPYRCRNAATTRAESRRWQVSVGSPSSHPPDRLLQFG